MKYSKAYTSSRARAQVRPDDAKEERKVAETAMVVRYGFTSDDVEWLPYAQNRMSQALRMSGASMVYGSYIDVLEDGSERQHPAGEHLFGSVRDDFDFGALLCVDKALAADAMKKAEAVYYKSFGKSLSITADKGQYLWWLMMRHEGNGVIMLPETLYRLKLKDARDSGAKQHDYVSPASREYQRDMESEFTAYLNYLGALLKSRPLRVNVTEGHFEFEASVIIPVRNRVGTIADAVRSALSQKTDFIFNVIVVDNASTDGTSEILSKLAQEDDRLYIYEVAAEEGLGIGGCWNRALMSEHCGRFAVQLDSDDVYDGEGVLKRIVNKFHIEKCGMVVGSYTLTDNELNEIEPGLIAHKEWTPLNGRNNLLRINGMGAPRAFYTPLARHILFPNVSYGEDYAMALTISSRYYVGRIYESLYHCRRWKGNSDAALSVEQVNAHNLYKDTLRTIALRHRMKK
ncbi:MAG: glycosyltransferase [Muribaculaceae bacterium]|nr:glycosyltransferase [Muribaculaceae bacterium]